jgi:hypothetical protein
LTLEDFLCSLVVEQSAKIDALTEKLIDITRKYHALLGYKDAKEAYEKSGTAVDMDKMMTGSIEDRMMIG